MASRGYPEAEEYEERVVEINRVSKVLRGGRRFGFRTVVIIGDRKGKVGMGIGKAREVPSAVRKGIDQAKRHMVYVPLSGATIPYPVIGQHGATKVVLRPAAPGTGVIAGGPVRAVVEAAGVHDILSKALGSRNALNVVLATFDALSKLRDPAQIAEMRGKPLAEMRPFWERKADE